MTIRAVFFDMGGTIETFKTTREIRLKATLDIQQRLQQVDIDLQIGSDQLCETISRGLEHYKRLSIQTMEELPPQRVWTEYVFAGMDVDGDRLASVAEELMFLVETRFYCRAMRPEIPAVLQAIKQMGLTIGLISNVNSQKQVPVNLKQYGILDYFQPIVLSSEFGRRKPDPAIFHHAARLANVPASACLYVGDRVVRDIQGAKRAGYGKAIQIRHDFDHGEDDTGFVPDAVIEDMNELLDILRADREAAPAPAASGKIRALIFDAGDVLYYRPERGAKFSRFLKALGKDVNLNLVQAQKAIEHKAYRGQISDDEYRDSIVRLYGITESEQIERGKQALIDDDFNVAFFDGIAETLQALKRQGFLLAIITDTANTISAKLAWFERGGFGHVWDSIVSSKEIGTRKPDPRIYERALQQLGITADQAVFIGHKSSELHGAKALGMKTVAFNYDEDATADYYLAQFPDLLTVPQFFNTVSGVEV